MSTAEQPPDPPDRGLGTPSSDAARALGRALEREAAVAGVLRTLATSSFELRPVLQEIIEQAVRLCDADLGNIARREGETYHVAAFTGFPEEYEQLTSARPYRAERGSVLGRALLDRRAARIDDVLEDPEYELWEAQRLGEYRSIMAVPLVRDDEAVGVMGVGRMDLRPFSDEDEAVLQTFADHASVALELHRLLAAEHEAAARERAVSAVLQEMARSSFDLQGILQTVVDSAVELASADVGNILRYDEPSGLYQAAAYTGDVSAEFLELVTHRPVHPDRGTLVGRTLVEQRPVHIVDVLDDPEYRFPEAQQAGGFRTILGVPMLRNGFVIGVFVVWRTEVNPFSDREIALLSTFADQATLAIENVRLFQAVERQLDELSRFAPQVAALLASDEGQSLLAGHRREITALFADLRGFTAFAETAEPEEVLSVLREYHATVGELATRHSGTLEHFAGDGLMVFFNDPVLIPDHQLAAVRTALAMRDRFEDLAAGWRKRGYELGLGIGLASGYATLGRIGFPGRYDYGAVGNAVILASRLSDAAGPGEVLASQRLHAAVEDRVEAETVGELDLKGLSRPVTAFRVRSTLNGDVAEPRG
ncbi:MAG: GAF domain-containing protein [Chloroflexi bacterium]|nr:GAF domain-containing protein [Chloroflexota bacterium]